ncbi:MAG TPA: hypothetical protein VIL72_04125, partial [Beijerinckiaceae bacterium]
MAYDEDLFRAVEVAGGDGGALVETRPLSDADAAALAKAVRALETESLTARLTSLVGKRFVSIGALVPAPARLVVARATHAALRTATRTALLSLGGATGPARIN